MVFKGQRWTLANLLPVFFVLWVIGSIWTLYVCLHLLYLTQVWRPTQLGQENTFDEEMYRRGIFQTVVSQFLTVMLSICFSLAIFTDPGSVPENAEWMPDLAPRSSGLDPVAEEIAAPSHHEVKHTGAPRYCKWCNCYKPDRCHHCRVCRSCILRMDHHCPWIANCVGYRNHKHFLLLGFYSASACIFFSWTMSESLHRALVEETTFIRRFLVVFGMTLSVMIGLLLTVFFLLHLWLMLRATTTIEFCEKAYRRNGMHSGQLSIYDRGKYQNVCDVLGSNPFLWLVPCAMPDSDGLHFEVREDVLAENEQQGSSPRGGAMSSTQAKGGDESKAPEVTGQQAANS